MTVDTDTIVALKAQGKTDAEIREATGATRSQLRNLRKAGILPPQLRRGGGWNSGNGPQGVKRRILDYQKEGLTDRQMAERMGVSISAIRVARRKHGIPATHHKPGRSQQIAVGKAVPGKRTQPKLSRFAYEFRGNLYVFKAPPAVVAAAERAYARTMEGGKSC